MNSRLVSPQFQSTPSVWRATRLRRALHHGREISIHALRVEGDPHSEALREPVAISIHALRVEGDPKPKAPKAQSAISIHALRVEGDQQCKWITM